MYGRTEGAEVSVLGFEVNVAVSVGWLEVMVRLTDGAEQAEIRR